MDIKKSLLILNERFITFTYVVNNKVLTILREKGFFHLFEDTKFIFSSSGLDRICLCFVEKFLTLSCGPLDELSTKAEKGYIFLPKLEAGKNKLCVETKKQNGFTIYSVYILNQTDTIYLGSFQTILEAYKKGLYWLVIYTYGE